MTSIERKRPVVLVAIDWYLPAYRAGGPIRSIANLVAALGDEIDFRIVCGNRDLGDVEDLPVPTRCWTPLHNASVQYLPQDAWTASTWKGLMEEVQPDRLYLNSLYSGPFSRLPWKVAKSMGIPTTLAPRGMLGPGALSIKPWRKKAWLTVQRWSGNYERITWHASTAQERNEIEQWFPKAQVHIALNLPVPYDPLPLPTTTDTLHLLSVGRVHPIKNYSLGVSLANALAQQGHNVTYRIVGPVEDGEEAKKLKASAQDIILELLGASPSSSIRRHLSEAHLVLVFTFGPFACCCQLPSAIQWDMHDSANTFHKSPNPINHTLPQNTATQPDPPSCNPMKVYSGATHKNQLSYTNVSKPFDGPNLS